MLKLYAILVLVSFFSIYNVLEVTSNDDDISIIRQRVLDWTLLPAKENITATVKIALNYKQRLNSSCYWPDIVYNDTRLAMWRTMDHLYRIATMLQALVVNGSRVQNDPQLRTAIHCALNVWLVNDWQSANWVNNEARGPLWISAILLMLGGNVTDFELAKIKEISFRAAWWIPRDRYVGTNLAWMLEAEIYRSLATNNITGIEQSFTRMWQDVAVQSADNVGIQYDWSYHFHGAQLLSGAYGMFWAQIVFGFALCTQQTKYAINEEQLSVFAQHLTKGNAWMIIGKNWDWHVIGRAVDRTDKEYFVLYYTEYIRKIAELVKANDTKIELFNLADRLDGYSNASKLIGNKHFFVSDYQIHRRSNWTSSITMQSNRTQPIECVNDEDLKGELSGQGVLNLYKGNDYAYDDIFPLLDWQAINGITVEHGIEFEPCIKRTFAWINRTFVGGVSDNQYGMTMMDTATHNLTAQRSWHFYDDAIIALATNLTLRSSTTAWTTLASRLLPSGQISVGFFNSTIITLNDGNYSFPYAQDRTSNVQWIHVGKSDIGYLLQNQQQYTSLGIDLGVKTGNYQSIGPFNDTVTARVLTIWINHGRGPYTLDYNYMILPDVSLESIPARIKQYDEEQIFSCQSTNQQFHGVMWPTLKRASFVLWDDIATTFSCNSSIFEITLQLSDAGAYLYSENTNSFTITASHPTRLDGNVKVNVNRVGSGESCRTSWNDNAQTTDVTLSLPSSKDFLGASVNVTCKK
jgi:chondroitin AC lyase